MEKDARILVTGHRGMVGQTLINLLKEEGFENIVTCHATLVDPYYVSNAFEVYKPDYVFHLAAKVYGIGGNMANQAESFYLNTLINSNVVEASRKHKVKKIVAMGSGCVYSQNAPTPFREVDIWHGGLPHSSEYGYAHAKRAMLAQLECSDMPYAFVVSSNLYGPNDRFNTETGHVIPSLIAKFYNDAVPEIWGHGTDQRDFMHVSDAARALLLIMDKIEGPVNMGSDVIHSIANVASMLQDIANKKIIWDTDKPEGQAHRSYDLTKLYATEFNCEYDLRSGLKETYDWYAANHETARR